MIEQEPHDVGKERSTQFSIRRMALGLALALSIGAAVALSYELVSVFIASSDDPAALAEAEEKASGAGNFQFSFPVQPTTLPEIHFVDGDGRPFSLADFRGRPVLLNIWATWCVPCRKEMPSLDRLQAKFDPSQLLVLTLSIDHQGVSAVKKFYQELALKFLGIYIDQPGAALSLLRAPGLPTTLLIDRDGLEVGRKIGPAEWDSPQTVTLLRERLGLPPSGGSVQGGLE